MSITVTQALAEYRLLLSPHPAAAKRQSAADSKQKLDASSILSALGRKPSLEDASAFSNKFKPVAAVSSQAARCVSHIDALVRDVAREKERVRGYRVANRDFRELLASYVKGEEEKSLKFWQAQANWKDLRRSVAGLQLCDGELLREFAALDGLFQILHFHFTRRTDRMQVSVRSKLEAALTSSAFDSLLREDWLAVAALQKLLDRPLFGQGKPNELSNQDEIDTNHSSNKKMLFKSSISKRTAKTFPKRVAFDSELRSKLSLSQPNDAQQAANRRSCDSLASQPAPKQGQLCVIDLEDSQPQTTLKSRASLCDEARAAAKKRLFEVVLPFFNIRVARCYAERVEADIFALFHANLKLYRAKARSCATVLHSLLAKQLSLDSLMTTCFDYSQLKRLSESLVQDLDAPPLPEEALGKRSAACLAYRPGPSSVSDMQPLQIREAGLSPFDSDDADSAELLAEVVRLREREIAQYTQLLQQEVREHLELSRQLAMVQEQLASTGSK